MTLVLQRLALAPRLSRGASRQGARVAAHAATRPLRTAALPLPGAQQPCALARVARRGACSAAAPRRSAPPLRASAGGGDEQPSSGLVDTGSNLLFGVIWVSLVAYAALWAPDQTPARDAYFLEKLLGLGADDGVPLNAVWFFLFNIMGVWPAVYAALLTPAGRSANGVPAWPFVTGSFALGAFSLLPFFALWAPPAEAPPLPTMAELKDGGIAKVRPACALLASVTSADRANRRAGAGACA